MNDAEIESRIDYLGLSGPRVTQKDVNDFISKRVFYRFPDTTLTICCLYLKNGYTVTGESACISTENYNEELGKSIAETNAIDKIWELLGFLMKHNLYLEKNSVVS